MSRVEHIALRYMYWRMVSGNHRQDGLSQTALAESHPPMQAGQENLKVKGILRYRKGQIQGSTTMYLLNFQN